MSPREVAAVLSLLLNAATAAAEPPGWRPDVQVERAAHAALARVRAGAVLTPFETDGCSGGMSAVWRLVAESAPAFASSWGAHPPWEPCCVAHDLLYHAGGSGEPAKGYGERLAADAALRACVAADLAGTDLDAAAAAIAETMFVAVRMGGGPCSGLPWRWGYGWPQCSVLTD
jgi:hypothetical protein